MSDRDLVRTFRAADPRAALDAVKAALGTEAVIVDTREVGGLWGRSEIEVTAMRSMPEQSRNTAAAGFGAAGGGDAGLQSEIGALRRVVDELRARLSSSALDGANPREGGMMPEAVTLCRQLVRRGADARLAEELLQEAMREFSYARGGETRGGVELEDMVRSIVGRRLAGSRVPWQKDEQDRRVVALVGPTGVGKTTTIAKIAARAMLENKLRVALITVDTYRIGACEHLGRYGEIMGVKTQVARDATSLAAAVARADADLVLIDSAGRSDAETIANQMGLLRAAPGAEMHLVLSAASGAREIAAAARRYREHGVQRLIFTKLDEADGPGSVLSAVASLPRPVSCVADGQRVPDDLHAAGSNLLVDLVVGPQRNKESVSWTRQRV
jgi:flagellar biosynthesis protein FlhF